MIAFARAPAGCDEALPQTWRPIRTSTGGRTAMLVCKCGHVGTVLEHDIMPDGTVIPSVCCQGCDFHDHVKLEGWQP